MQFPNVRVVSFGDIAPEVWNNVAALRSRSPKLLYDWAHCMATAYSRNGEGKVIVVGPVSQPDALLPLSIAPGLLRWHRFVANDDGGLSIPCRDVSVLPAVADALVRLRVPVDLGYYPAKSPLIAEIRRACRGRAMAVVRSQQILCAPWLDLDSSWEEPTANLRRNLRQSIRRNGRRLEEAGQVDIAFIEPAENDVDALLDTYAKIESRSWKERAGTSLSRDKRQLAFLRLYARAVAKAGRLHLTLLSLDGRPVAMSIGEIYDNVFWYHKTSFDEAFDKFGPGVLMQYHLVSHLARRGVERIEFQGQLVDYKRGWTDHAVETVALRIYPFTTRGIAAAGYDSVRQARKRFETRKFGKSPNRSVGS